ncbi:hypothetical protein C1T17_11415 [Sphingobium sp. SCG-1]|uniref:nuclear transport factor 2 family protein n=1 Tax=Sphingobium sp. SCG-1 TaxID=2072936 RepID=UPI000CD6BCBD|nr:nuclear transport factor 2 family protein [Sphingobium sp. SCG-1]AUW58616.1 hypothetical protein C1T17_11415 [Sphingobium sp. SCG-1]
MGSISTVDLQTKMDVHELLSRFCHFLDHNGGLEWARLFTPTAVIEKGPLGCFAGHSEICQIPAMVAEKGNGLLRHHLTNVMFERTGNVKELIVEAYFVGTDWGQGGAMVHSADFKAVLHNRCHWQISRLELTPIAQTCVSASHQAPSLGSLASVTVN